MGTPIDPLLCEMYSLPDHEVRIVEEATLPWVIVVGAVTVKGEFWRIRQIGRRCVTKPGRNFEKAVYTVAKALDPSAEVIFDHRVPDRDVPELLRQVDVWINAKLGGHVTITVYISCKDYNRKLHIGDVERFITEVRSTSASTGIIYSPRGFSRNAVEKARKNGMACCRLYQDAPADLPSELVFYSYVCAPKFSLTHSGLPKSRLGGTWDDLFVSTVDSGTGSITVLKALGDAWRTAEASAVEQATKNRSWPTDKSVELSLRDPEGLGTPFSVTLRLSWTRYRGRLDAHLLNGSYCLTDDRFRGSQTGPWIDTRGTHPGEGWEELVEDTSALPAPFVLSILRHRNFEENAVRSLGASPLKPR